MYLLKPLYCADGSPSGIIISLTSIHQSCMLVFIFGKSISSTWTTHNVLDVCQSFLVNSWSSMYSYKTIW